MSLLSASAPGTLMLLGEHAVLDGRLALAAAVDARLKVTLVPHDTHAITIHSTLGTCECTLTDLGAASSTRLGGHAFRFIIMSLRQYASQLPSGFRLEVETDFSDTIGFGSSAAVTVATHLVLRHFCNLPTDPTTLFRICLDSVRNVQGMGSGTDLAACIHGGVVAYRAHPFEWTPLTMSHPITVVYSGHKTPTPEVIRYVHEEKTKRPEAFVAIYDAIEQSVLAAIEAIRNHDGLALGQLLNENQRYMCDMGVCDDDLETIVTYLQNQPGIFGAKISGSGLGDCAVGLGTADVSALPYASIPSRICEQGATLDEG